MSDETTRVEILRVPRSSIRDIVTLGASFLAVVISIVTAFVTYTQHYSPSDVTSLPFSGYAIKRSHGEWPSDHLIIPLEFVNSGSRPGIVRQPTLHLTNRKDMQTKKFYVAGEYPGVSWIDFSSSPALKQSFMIPAHEASVHTIVFHVEDWYDRESENYRFRFDSNQIFDVVIEWFDEKGKAYTDTLGVIDTFDAGDFDTGGKKWWDFWPVHLGDS